MRTKRDLPDLKPLHRIFHLLENKIEIEESHHLFAVQDFHDLINKCARIMTCMLEGGLAVHDEQMLQDICSILNEWAICSRLLPKAIHKLELWNIKVFDDSLLAFPCFEIDDNLLPGMKIGKCLLHGID